MDLTPEDTKTDESRRIYFGTIKELQDVFIEADQKKKAGQDLEFTKGDGNPVPKWYIRNLLIDACKIAKIGPYRLRDMRHTFNTNMRKAGVDQVLIMKLTGHKNNEMFLRYSHIDQKQSESAMDKLNGFLSQKNEDEK